MAVPFGFGIGEYVVHNTYLACSCNIRHWQPPLVTSVAIPYICRRWCSHAPCVHIFFYIALRIQYSKAIGVFIGQKPPVQTYQAI